MCRPKTPHYLPRLSRWHATAPDSHFLPFNLVAPYSRRIGLATSGTKHDNDGGLIQTKKQLRGQRNRLPKLAGSEPPRLNTVSSSSRPHKTESPLNRKDYYYIDIWRQIFIFLSCHSVPHDVCHLILYVTWMGYVTRELSWPLFPRLLLFVFFLAFIIILKYSICSRGIAQPVTWIELGQFSEEVYFCALFFYFRLLFGQ